MSEQRKLVVEMLSGPLDGATSDLDGEAEWSRAGAGPLAFPWDEELGTPQAHFRPMQDGWNLEPVKSPRGTYRMNVNGPERIAGAVAIEASDLLKASGTWLLVRTIE